MLIVGSTVIVLEHTPCYWLTILAFFISKCIGAPQTPSEKNPGSALHSSRTFSQPTVTDTPPASDIKSTQTTSDEQPTFSPGNNVRVELDVEVFKMMQEGHGDVDQHLLDVSLKAH